MARTLITADDICPETPGNAHEPDWLSITTESDGGEIYLDVNCIYCGRSGCVGTVKSLADEISW